jgi:mono/diheme cytochrome c family protein
MTDTKQQRMRYWPLLAISLFACEEKKFSEPFVLADGTEISVATLEKGYTAYTLYCRACHGDNGDGQGPAALGLRPPPRDFRLGKFKFAAVPAGELPSDQDLRRIIRQGLAGTAMLPWELPDNELDATIQYIKTFKKQNEEENRWQTEPVGKQIIASIDPFAARSDEERSAIEKLRADPSYQGQTDAEKIAVEREKKALLRGEKIYHVVAQCVSCHPSYATRQTINAYNQELRGNCLSPAGFRGFSENDALAMYQPAPKDSDYRYPPTKAEVEALFHYAQPYIQKQLDALEDSNDKAARYDEIDAFIKKLSPNIKQALKVAKEITEQPKSPLRKPEKIYLKQVLSDTLESKNTLYLTPPDFTFHTIRSGVSYADLYRTIAAGIGGTPMPAWFGVLPDEDIWAMVHYVSYLVDLKDRTEALAKLREQLAAQPKYEMPQECFAPTPASQPTSAPQ